MSSMQVTGRLAPPNAERASQARPATTANSQRLPRWVGLSLAAFVSLSLWALIAYAVAWVVTGVLWR